MSNEDKKNIQEKKVRNYKFDTKIICFCFTIFMLVILQMGGVLYLNYKISWDQHFVDNINQRALTEGYASSKITDFSDAVVAKNDALGMYEKKVWKLQHKEIYYIEISLFAFLNSFLLSGLFVCGFINARSYNLYDLERDLERM